MLWQALLEQFAVLMGTNVVTAGMFLSLLLTLSFMIAVLILTQGRNVVATLVIALISLVMFMVIGWMDWVIGAALAIPLAIFVAWYASQQVKTGGD